MSFLSCMETRFSCPPLFLVVVEDIKRSKTFSAAPTYVVGRTHGFSGHLWDSHRQHCYSEETLKLRPL